MRLPVRIAALCCALPAMAQVPALAIASDQGRGAYSLQGTGARAVGTGGAFIAVADDATAASFNPAGLAQLQKPELSLVLERMDRRMDYQGFSEPVALGAVFFSDGSTTDHRSRPLFGSLALPFQVGGKTYTVQLSRQRILEMDLDADRAYTLHSTVPLSADQRVDQSTRQEGGVQLTSLAFAAELSPRILLGASANWWGGGWSYASRRTALSLSPLLPQTVQSDLSQENHFRGFNANLGLLWRTEYATLGLTYRTPFDAAYQVRSDFRLQTLPGTLTQVRQDPGMLHVHWPESMGLGLALRPMDRLSLVADAVRTRWSAATVAGPGVPGGFSYQGQNFFNLNAQAAGPSGQAADTPTPDGTDLRGGVEWVAFLGEHLVVPLRAGLFREPQPLVDGLTREQRVLRGWTLGGGLKFRHLAVDVAWKHAHAERRVSQFLDPSGDLLATALPATGSERIKEDRLYLTAILQFDYGDALKRALRWAFVGD